MKPLQLFLSLKFRILFIIFTVIVVISFVLIQYGYSTARASMISEKKEQIRQTTKNGQEEVEAAFEEALRGNMSADDALKLVIRRLSGPIKLVKMTTSLNNEELLFMMLIRQGFSADKIRRLSKIERHDGKLFFQTSDQNLALKIFDLYFHSGRAEKNVLEKEYDLWIIRDYEKASIKIGSEGYLYMVNTVDPEWLLPGTSYPGDYSIEAIRSRIENKYRNFSASIDVEDYIKKFGDTPEKQMSFIQDYMTRKNENPNPVYLISHPLLGFRNADNIVTADGKMIGRDITVIRNGDYEYMWKNKDEAAARKKIAHFRMFQLNDLKGRPIPGTRWVITTGAYEKEAYASIVDLKFNLFMISTIIAAVFMFIIFVGIHITLIRPLGELMEGVKKVNEGVLDFEVPVRQMNEIGYLSQAFNKMLNSLRESHRELAMTNEAYSKFVPKEFLKHLDKNSILDVKLGDQSLRDMTVLFSDIRSFTSLSEEMSPKDTFDFLNSYLEKIGPIIRDNGGFIDKYIGDAIMAIFPNGPENAVRAAVNIQLELENYNFLRKQWQKQPVRAGIGIHTGSLMLGVIGENMRLDSTVISDAVNVASRLEELTKKLGAGILISSRIESEIRSISEFHTRKLGKFKVKGKKEPVEIYEIYDHDGDEMIQRKENLREKFEEGVDFLARSMYDSAGRIFQEILTENPGDVTVQKYMNRSLLYIERQ